MSFDLAGPGSLTKFARLTGAMYLAFILASVVADRLGHIGFGDSQQIYDALVTDVGAFRVAVVLGFASSLFFVTAAWGLYVLLRRGRSEVALLFLLLNATGVAVQCASLLWLISAMLQGDPSSGLSGVSVAQAHSSTLVSIDTYRIGFVTAQLFYGTWLFPLGFLVLKSELLPRFLGVLLILDGVGELVWFLQGLLLPDRHAITYPGTAVSLVAEVALALWLLVRGVRVGESTSRSASARPDVGHPTPR